VTDILRIGDNRRRLFLSWLYVILLAATSIAVGVVLLWPVADLVAKHDVGGALNQNYVDELRQARDAARGRIIQLGTGLLAIGALIYTGRSFALANKEAGRQANASQRTLQLTQQGQVTDRYTKAG
jgi:hypothetical protein